MDVAKHLFVIGAWAPLTSSVPAAASAVRPVGKVQSPADSVRQSRPPEQTPSCSIPTTGKSGGRYMRTAGYGRPIPRTSSAVSQKAGIEQRSGSASKVNSSSSDDTATAPQPGEGHSKPVVARPGSSPQLATAPAAPAAELPTVAEVLRSAKLLLQPTHAVERQFYADCYRACQVIPTSRPPPASATAGSGDSVAAAASTSSTPPAQQPYLSYVPEVALRLSCLGHRIVVRRVTDSKHYWSKSMTNLFCYCVLPGTGIGYVLDPSFKEHFRAGRMSDRYRDVWECLPPLFVGPPAKLVQLVQTLCAELQASFESSGRQLPPWRTFGSTINRWMSPCFRDVPVPPRRPMPPQPPQPELQSAAGGGGGVAGVGAAAGAGAGGGNGSGGRSSSAGMIPAGEAQAFLRVCEELIGGTPSARLRAAGSGGGGAGVSGAATTAAAAAIGMATASSEMAGAHETGGQPQPQPSQQPQQEQQEGGGDAGAGPAGGGERPVRRVTGFEPLPPTGELGRLALRSPATAARAAAAAGMAVFGRSGPAAARPAATAATAAEAAAAAPGGAGPTWSAAAGPRPARWGAAGAAHGGPGLEQGARSAGQAGSSSAATGGGGDARSTDAAVADVDPGAGFTVRGAAAAAMAAAAAAAAGTAAAAAAAAAPRAGQPPPVVGRAAGPTQEQTRPEAVQSRAAAPGATSARAPAGLLSRNLRSFPPQP